MGALTQAYSELSTRFNPTEALAALELMEERRRREQYVKYWEPTPQQTQAIRAFKPEVKILVIRGGNRSGKTDVGAALMLATALGKDFFQGEPAYSWAQFLPFEKVPVNIWAVGLDFNSVRDVIWGEKLREGRGHPAFLPMEQVGKISDGDYRLELKNKTKITCKSADSGWEKFQGASVDLVWLDEECDETIFDECFQRTVDCRGKILVTLTPLVDISSGVRNPWVYKLYQKMKAGDKSIAFVDLSVMENPYVPEDEKQRLLDKWANHPEGEARLYGKFISRSGLVYPMWNPAVHIVPRRMPKGDEYKIVMIDPAPVGPTAALAGVVDAWGNIEFYQEYKESGAYLTAGQHAKNLMAEFGGQLVDFWGMDPKGGNQQNAETHKTICDLYKEAGLRDVRLVKLPEDYGLEASREYLIATLSQTSRQPKVTFQEHLVKFRDEVENYTWAVFQRGDQRGLSKEKPRKGNDDLMDCFRYICGMRPKGVRRVLVDKADWARSAPFRSYT